MEIISVLKPHIITLVEKCSAVCVCVCSGAVHLLILFTQLKLWIELKIPKIEDGNNFGVSIQVGN